MHTSTTNPDTLASAPLDVLQADISAKTGRGVNAMIAGVILWTLFGVAGALVADEFILGLVYLFGAGLLFPFSLLVAKVLRLDPYAKGNPLGPLAGILGGLQILFIPLMWGAVFVSPASVPWFLAVLVGAHLLPYAWLYRSRAYLVASIGIPIAAGLIGWLLADVVRFAAPAAVVVLLAVTALMLHRENRAG